MSQSDSQRFISFPSTKRKHLCSGVEDSMENTFTQKAENYIFFDIRWQLAEPRLGHAMNMKVAFFGLLSLARNFSLGRRLRETAIARQRFRRGR
mmetsp:Transcript_21000/g.40217  ORF Transcript_21000/g.40217 Transcript_21000/m.40217 type:complete len:94 (+) Transcript_21000:201-482(+)